VTRQWSSLSAFVLATACVAALALNVSAQSAAQGQPKGAQRPAATTPQEPAASKPPAAPKGPFDQLAFREIGPASPSGRIDDFAVLERNPVIFYVAAATGGVWKTVNAGTTFEPVFDNEGSASVGDIAIAPDDPNLVWVGTGENNNRQSSSWGDGVYKSTDGGATWKTMGLPESRQIARIIVDPVDHDVVYVAALGNLWGSGGERGIYKTADGGLTWTRVLFVDDETGATELLMDPSNNKTLYAATYQRRRATWGFNGGGPGSGIWKSTDAGRTWTKLAKGLPEGPLGRIGLDVYRKNPSVVYARVEHARESGVYRSDDAGASWTKLSNVNPRPMYFSQIRIDPTDDHRIYVLGVQLHVSDDGGRTFRNDGARLIHVDFHAMWIDPANSDHLMIGGDGGVGISHDRSKTYVWLNNLPLAQFYHVAYDMKRPYTVCGGLQDNNTWCGPSAVRNLSGIANDDWFVVSGGDGFMAQIDPSDPNIIYAESQDGRMSRIDRVTNERKAIRPEPPEGEKPYRWNWDTPVVVSPHDPATVFVAANRVFRSTDRGHSWKAASPDLTSGVDRETLSLMGVAGKEIALAKNDGVSAYATLVTFAESPKKAGIYWAGSDDGLVQVSRDAGADWTNVTAKIAGLPKNAYVSRLSPSRFDEATAYATFDDHRLGDFGTYVYATTDLGTTWRSIAGDLPKGQVARTITEDLKNPDVLYLGTETGLFVTLDRGRSWQRVKANLPTVPVYEITLHTRDDAMLLATHGRGVWILDDLTPIQQYAKARTTDAFVFEPPPAFERNPSNERMREFEGDRRFLGTNPPSGVAITYWLKSAVKDVKLIVRDASGSQVREIAGDATKGKGEAGLNTVVWDLRVQPLPPLRNQPPSGGPGGGGGGFGGGGVNGPLVLPGPYKVSVVTGSREVEARTVNVSPDPEIKIADADRKTHFETAMGLHRLQATANEAYDVVATLNQQFGAIRDLLRAAKDVPGPVQARVDAFEKQLTPQRRQFGVTAGGLGGPGGPGGAGGAGGGGFPSEGGPPMVNLRTRIGQLKGGIMASTSLPTEVQARMIEESRMALSKAVGEVNALIPAMDALYKDLEASGVHAPLPEPVKPITTQTRTGDKM